MVAVQFSSIPVTMVKTKDSRPRDGEFSFHPLTFLDDQQEVDVQLPKVLSTQHDIESSGHVKHEHQPW